MSTTGDSPGAYLVLMHMALLNHLAEFNNSKAKVDQKEHSGLTKEIHFKLDDDNDDNQNDNKDDGHLSHSAMLVPNDDQFFNPKAMVQ